MQRLHRFTADDRHRWAVNRLNEQFSDQRRDLYEVNCESLSLKLETFEAPEPDVALTAPATAPGPVRAESVTLLIEIADSSRDRDLGPKRAIYARAGIPEYWVFDLQHDVVLVFREPLRERNEYTSETTFGPDAAISPTAYPGVIIDVSSVLGR